jgi:hypothetical protein
MQHWIYEFIADSYIAAENDRRLGDRLKWPNKRSALDVFVGWHRIMNALCKS